MSPERHLCDSKCMPSTKCLQNVEMIKDKWLNEEVGAGRKEDKGRKLFYT